MLNYYHGRDYLSTRNRTMIALFFDTGMRLNHLDSLLRVGFSGRNLLLLCCWYDKLFVQLRRLIQHRCSAFRQKEGWMHLLAFQTAARIL